MPTDHGPVFGRRRLRIALRKKREAAGLNQDRVAKAMDWSLSKLIRIEAGIVSISTNDVKALLQHYGVTDPTETAEFVEMARVARRRPWWSPYKDVPSEFASYLGLEAEASVLRYFHPTSIPGLIQTNEYATAITETISDLQIAPDEVRERVEIRMRRQREVLERDDPPTVDLVLDQGVLHRTTGGPEVMREQLRQIADIGARENVTIRILPFTAGAMGVMGPFWVLEFPDEADTDVVYIEGALFTDMFDQPSLTDKYVRTYERLCGSCLSPDDSLDLIRRIAGEL